MNGSNRNDNLIAELVTDCVCHHLRKNGYGTPTVNCNSSNDSPSMKRWKKAIRTLCDEFERRYDSIFVELCSQLDAEKQQQQQIVAGGEGTTSADVAAAHSIFLAVVNELFTEGVTWSRIVAFFALAGSLSLKFTSNGQRHLVNCIVEWTCIYIKTHLEHWIDDHSGWDGIVDFCNGHPDKRLESPWPTLKNFVCGIAAGAIGALTLGAILTSKT